MFQSISRCFLLFIFCLPLVTYSQDIKAFEGTEFWFGFMDNSAINYGPGAPLTTEPLKLTVQISSRVATSGTISIPNLNWYHQFIVYPDSILKINIPKYLARHPNFNITELKGIHIVSKAPVSVTALNYLPASADGSSILPVDVLGSEYYLTSFAPSGGGDVTGRSEFLIVATVDSTVIQITPKVALIGRPANTTYTIVLNKGETYQNKASSLYNDVSGTLVKGAASNGSCKPFAVFSGSQSTYIPSYYYYSDHLYEQMIPTNYWGTKYFVSPFALIEKHSVIIVSKTNGTQITINGGAPITLNQGQSLKRHDNVTTSTIVATQPISVFMFMQGEEYSPGPYGDPAMLAINNSDQTINFSRFATFNDSLLDTNYVNIIAKTPERNSIYLDGSLIPDNLFSLFTSNSSMSYAKIPISRGIHELKSDYAFQGYVYGMGASTYTSYGYNLGWYQPQETVQMYESICTSSDTLLSAPAGYTDVWWSTLSNANDTVALGVNYLAQASNSFEVYIVHGNNSGNSCSNTAYYSVENPSLANSSIDIPTSTVCNFSEIEVGISSNLNSVPFYTTWSPTEQFDNPNSNHTILRPEQSGWYYATITSLDPGCYTLKDSVYINVGGGEITETKIVTSDTTLCFGDTAALELNAYRKIGLDDFEGTIDPTIWNSVTGAITDNACGSHNGLALYFNGAPQRVAETVPFDVLSGGKISFYLKTGSASSLCDDPELGDNVLLQYSLDNGATWITFRTLYEYHFTSFQFVEEEIPVASFSSSTKFRLIQPLFSGANSDVWILDRFIISKKDNTGSLSWTPTNYISNTNGFTTEVYPQNTSYYYSSLIDQGCVYTDSVLIHSSNFSATIEETISCNNVNSTLTAHVSDAGDYSYSWQSTDNSYYPTDSIINLVAQVQNDTFNLNIVSGEGCILTESLIISPHFFEVTIFGDTSICLNDTTTLIAGAFLNTTDDFNSSVVNDDIWTSISGGTIAANCSVYDGTNLYFGTNINRSCETQEFDFSNGGILSFNYAFGTESGYTPTSCSLPNANQYVTIEYSIDNGLSWNFLSGMGQLNTYPIAEFRYFSMEIPSGACSPNTKFRWKQNNISTAYGSNWMLDDVTFSRRLPNTLSYSWYHMGNLISTDSTVSVSPTDTTVYTVQITDNQTSCTRSTNAVVRVGQPYFINLPDINLCHTDSVTLIPQPTIAGDYSFNWYQFEQWPILLQSNISADSIYSFYANSQSAIVVNSSSSSGCSLRDTVLVNMIFDLEEPLILGNTTVCEGDSTTIKAEMMESVLYSCQNVYQLYPFDGITANSNLGSVSGNAIIMSNSPRYFGFSQPITNGGRISFYVKSGDGILADATEIGDDLIIEYSIDNGATWNLISSVSTYQIFQFEQVIIDIPPQANSSYTLFRFSQTSYDGVLLDVIIVDEIVVEKFSSVPLNYSWSTNNTLISTDEAVTVSPTVHNQMYYVTIQDNSGTCVFTDSIAIDYLEFLVDAGLDTNICYNENLTLNGTTNCISPYGAFWSNGGNLIGSNTLQPQVITNVTSDYILNVVSGNCVVSDTVSVIVLQDSGINLADNATKCENDTLLIDLSGAINVIWSPTVDSYDAGGNWYGFYANQTNQYTVNYNTINGCSYSDSILISVESPILLSTIPDTTICVYDELLLTVQSNDSESPFSWNNGSTGINLLISNPGVYWVEQTNSCNTVRDSVTISDYPQLLVTVNNTDNVLSVNETFQTYQWIDCISNTTLVGEMGQSFTPLLNGSYAVIVFDGFCSDTSECNIINDLGVDGPQSDENVSINFNQASNELVIAHNGSSEYDLEIFDYSGKIVYYKSHIATSETIPLNNFSNSMYLIKIGGFTKRIFVNHN